MQREYRPNRDLPELAEKYSVPISMVRHHLPAFPVGHGYAGGIVLFLTVSCGYCS